MKAGDVVKVTNGAHYQLPPGLADGDTVRLIGFDHGYWAVEKDGQQFLVYLCRLDPGFEYELGERGLPETDWRLKAFREWNSKPLTPKRGRASMARFFAERPLCSPVRSPRSNLGSVTNVLCYRISVMPPCRSECLAQVAFERVVGRFGNLLKLEGLRLRGWASGASAGCFS
jgi:hypothetical protein